MVELLKFLLLLLSIPFIFGAVIIGIFFIFFYFYVTEASRRARKMSDEIEESYKSWSYEDFDETDETPVESDPKPHHSSVHKKVKHRGKRKYASSNDYSDTYDISRDLDGFGTFSAASDPIEDCPECQGVGVDDNGDPCPSCGGSGTTESVL